MSTNSILFLFGFLPIILIAYYLVPGKLKDWVLLLGSFVFYAWGTPLFALILAFSAAFNYFVALRISEENHHGRGAGWWLAGPVLINVALFLFFAFIGKLAGLTSAVPLGIGIYTLQAISYLVDVSRGVVPAQKKVFDFALYLAMFPQMAAGPVVKYRDVRKSLAARRISIGKLGEGMLLFLCGLLKKILFADRLAVVTDQIRALGGSELSALTAWIGVVAFALQFYFAFSGCCDMAMGLAKMFGFDWKKNFRYPYLAKNMTDFSTKWNQSLSAWFQEYVCEPLFGGWLGTLVSWILIGLWYSVQWDFAPWKTTVSSGLVWGLYMAFWLILERYFLRFLKRLPIILRNIYTMLFVLIGWVLFMSSGPARAGAYLKAMAGLGGQGMVDSRGIYLLVGNAALLILMLIGSTPLPKRIADFVFYHKKNKEEKNKTRLVIRRNAALVLGCLLLVVSLLNVIIKDKNAPEGTEAFVFRRWIASADTGINLLIGRREANGVYKGADHQLLADIVRADEEKITKTFQAIDELTQNYPDVDTYMAVIPDAANVWADKLPTGASTIDQTEQLAQMKESLSDSVTWIDAEGVLKSKKDKQIYYHTDSRWTTLGAKYVWEEIAAVMGLDTSQAPAVKAYPVTGEFNGNLSDKSGYETGYREPIEAYLPEDESTMIQTVVNYESEGIRTAVLYEPSALDEKDAYRVFLGGDYDKITIRTTADTTARLLLVKDDWANCMIPFLTPYFREIIVIDPEYYEGNVQNILEKNNITDVLFLYECNNLVQDDNLSGVLKNAETK